MSHFKEDCYIRISVYVICLSVFSLLCPGQSLVSGSQKRATQISDTSLILFFKIPSPSLICQSAGYRYQALLYRHNIQSLRAIKLSARIFSRSAERKAKKLSPPAHVRGQRVKKGIDIEARA